jgi:hypothetical protein
MISILEILYELQFEYIVVIIDAPVLDRLNREMLEEGRWVASKKRGWSLRIDPENPQLKQKRHVHITRDKHISSKNMQFAWNQNGTRHDKAAFSQNLGGIETAKKIARNALGLPDIVFEHAGKAQELLFLSESTTELVQTAPVAPVLLKARLPLISDESI